MFDILIIGAGVIGTSIARNLSKYDLKIAVVEKEDDVSLGASKANSGIVHGGYAGKSGTLKGALCIKGNQMYDQLEQELNFGFKRIGGLILGFDESDRKNLTAQMNNGLSVGENDFIWLDQKALREMEPYVNSEAQFALHIPSIGVTSPYEMTIAMIENAMANGVELFLGHEVYDVKKAEHYTVYSNKGQFESKYIINAAGMHAGQINQLFNDELVIKARRGQYIVFGKDQSHLVNHVLFQPPTDKGKGILVTPTYHGNLMIGPDAEDIVDDLTETHNERIKNIIKSARRSIEGFDLKRALTTFSGVRAMSDTNDFFIKEVSDCFITVAGIDSPGLTSAPAIAEYVVAMINKKQSLTLKETYNPIRKSYFDDSSVETICQCENISKQSILDCFEREIPIKSTDAIKRRVRAGMGNCQGLRCQPIIKMMIREKYNLLETEVIKRTEKEMPQRVLIQEIRKLEV